MSVTSRNFLPCLVLAGGLLGGCSSDDASAGVSRSAVVANYSANLYAAYSDSVLDEQAFQSKVSAFLADPTEDSLATARSSWFESRAHYMLTEGARFYDGPIDVDPPNHEGLIKSWPLDEAFIDYALGDDGKVNEDLGIVNMPELLPEITAEGLDGLNGYLGEPENVSSGYHAVEFLLWGQALELVGPGKRPATDYVIGGPSKNPDRRADYLNVAVEGIISQLTSVRDAWAPAASYRVGFEQDASLDASLTHIFTGLANMSWGELGSQRIGAAYKSKDRHDQHDCFSAKTLDDYERDALGLQAMYLGKYGDHDGPGLDELVKAADPAVDADLKKKLQASIDAIIAIPKPFEDAIAGDDESDGRQAIQAALTALKAQGDAFGAAAAAIGITITIDDPEP